MLILASQSATRKTLLENAGLRFESRPAAIDERGLEAALMVNGATPDAVAGQLAAHKALAVAEAHPDALVIGADQTLALGDATLHKPVDRAAARSQLLALAGRRHSLFSGVALARGSEVVWRHVERADLEMRAFTPAECDAVLALEGEAVLSSVGGYRLEGPSVRLFARITGDYFAILGLPLLALLEALRVHAPRSFLSGETPS